MVSDRTPFDRLIDTGVVGDQALVVAARIPAFGNPVRSMGRSQVNAGNRFHQESFVFHLKFAPHPGSFLPLSGYDLIDQIRFFHDRGFQAMEYNELAQESPEMQSRIGNTLTELDMTMGVFVGFADFLHPKFAVADKVATREVLNAVGAAIDVAKRVNATWFTVVPGSIDQQAPSGQVNRHGTARLAPGYQMANVIQLLRRCCELLEPESLVMVLEPLNWLSDHGGTFLRYSDQAYALCKAVDSPSCKILFDVYHQQITEGNLIRNIDQCWDEIAYFQVGDNPGRNEPGTGEIHYGNLFQHLYDKSRSAGREFLVGMEHGQSGEGRVGAERVIEAYQRVNPQVD